MNRTSGLVLTLLLLLMNLGLMAQAERESDNSLIDNNLKFMVISEKVRTRGMMEVCISDTSNNCIDNLVSGYVVRVYDTAGAEIWAGKTAGREDMLKFPAPLPDAAWIVLTAFKPYVLNRLTGARIHQDQPIETKYVLGNE